MKVVRKYLLCKRNGLIKTKQYIQHLHTLRCSWTQQYNTWYGNAYIISCPTASAIGKCWHEISQGNDKLQQTLMSSSGICGVPISATQIGNRRKVPIQNCFGCCERAFDRKLAHNTKTVLLGNCCPIFMSSHKYRVLNLRQHRKTLYIVEFVSEPTYMYSWVRKMHENTAWKYVLVSDLGPYGFTVRSKLADQHIYVCTRKHSNLAHCT